MKKKIDLNFFQNDDLFSPHQNEERKNVIIPWVVFKPITILLHQIKTLKKLCSNKGTKRSDKSIHLFKLLIILKSQIEHHK